MATLEEIVVQLVAESSQLRAELQNATKATTQATSKMDAALTEFTENSSKNLSFFEASVASGIGFLGSQAVLGAFSAAKDAASFLFEELITNGVQGAIEAENAQNKFNTALALTGKYSRETAAEFKAFGDSIQSSSNFTAEAALEAGALIQSLGNLETNGLKRATQAAVDLSAALGIDLQSAATLVGKAANGEVAAFSRFGIQMEKSGTSAQTFANALDTINAKFGGAAANQINTYAGQVNQLQNNWGDLTEVFGEALIKNSAVLFAMKELNAIISQGTGDLENNKNAMQVLIGEGLVALIDIAAVAVQTLDLLVRTVQFLAGVLLAVTSPMFVVIAGFETLINGVDAGKAVLDDWAESMVKDFHAFGESGDGALTNITEKLAGLSVAASSGLDAIKAGAEATIEPQNAAAEATANLAEQERLKQEQMKKLGETLTENQALLEAHSAFNAELLIQDLENELITKEEYNTLLLEQAQMNADAEQAILDQKRANDLMSETAYQTASLKIKTKAAADERKIKDQMKKDDEARQKLMMQGYGQFLDGLASLSQSSNKTLGAIGKAAAISKATIDAYLAIQNALATVPYPANIAAAAGIGVQAFANVARISGIGFNKGGTVPGGGANRDTVPAVLAPGEEIVNRDTANKLRNFLDNQGLTGGVGGLSIELTLKDDLVEFIEAKIIERQRLGTSLLGSV